MKKIVNSIKVFLVLAIIFSQLGNATLVLAEEVSNNDTSVSLNNNDNTTGNNSENNTDENNNDNTAGNNSENNTDENNNDNTAGNNSENNTDENNNDNTAGNNSENNTDENNNDNTAGNNSENNTDENNNDNTAGNNSENNTDENNNDNTAGNNSEDNKLQLTKDSLETLMDIYINGGNISDELKELLVFIGIPSAENGEIVGITLEDIMFVSELLKEKTDLETEREENKSLELVLGEIPEEVLVGDTFDVQVLISNEVLEIISDNEIATSDEKSNSEEFIDGIEGLITTSGNLKVTNVVFEEFTSINNEEGKFIGVGNEISEDGAVLLTITFEAIEEGEGKTTISGKVGKYLTISDFEDLTFSVIINSVEEIPVGLEALNSSVGEFDKEFNSDVTEYTLTIPEWVTEITLSGSLINSDDETTGLSAYTIDSDNKVISIIVTRDEGNKKIYTINVVRIVNPSVEEKEEIKETTDVVVPTPISYYVYSSNNYLKTLNIKDYEIDFNKSTLEYRLKVKNDVKFLDIMATPDDYRSRVEINGNGEFKAVDNIVTIKVTAENGDTKEYRLLVNKESKKSNVEIVEENNSKTEKTIIVVLIIMIVIGLLYLIFKKDEEDNKRIKK